MKYRVLCTDIRFMNGYRELGVTMNVRLLSLQLVLTAWLLSLPAFVYSRSLSTSKTCQINVLPKIRKCLGGVLTFGSFYGNVCSCNTNSAFQYYLLSRVTFIFRSKADFLTEQHTEKDLFSVKVIVWIRAMEDVLYEWYLKLLSKLHSDFKRVQFDMILKTVSRD